MRNKFVQMSLLDTYNDVYSTMDENKSAFLSLLEEHINLQVLIPPSLYQVFYYYSCKRITMTIRAVLIAQSTPEPR